MEYVLNALHAVAQLSVPIASGLLDGLSHVIDFVAPLGRLVLHTWLRPGVPFEAALAAVVGLAVFTIGSLILRRL